MKLTDTAVTGLDGKALMVQEGDKPAELRVASVIVNALLHPINDKGATGEQKIKRFNLAQKVYGMDGGCDISDDDAAEIRRCVGAVYSVIVVGYIYKLLEKQT